jgi:coenzyme F420-reducing hydrogenase delta subunit
MAESARPDVVVHVCSNCVPRGQSLPRQWTQNGAHVLVRQLPCTGKTDVQYLFHALEGGARGVSVVACPKGECTLAEGNYRAEIRVRTVQRILAEIGIEPERIELLHCSPEDSPEHFQKLVRDSVDRFCALGENPLSGERAPETTPAPVKG